MRFIDSNTFVYAILKSKHMDKEVVEIKRKCRGIIERINRGEEVATSIVHISEVVNILENRLLQKDVKRFLDGVVGKKNISIIEVGPNDYLLAGEFSIKNDIGINDALAVILMKKKGISEIYSFDRDFNKVDVERIEE